ncbi:MAG: hypothetical protein ACXWK0_06015 [Caulobacteraceae bacterium]
MSDAAATPLETDEDDRPAWDGAAGEGCPSSGRHQQMLDRLAEAGLEIALAIERRVKDAGPAQPLAELNEAALAYARVARGVRMAILLQNELVQGLEDAAEAARQAQAHGREAHTERAVRIVHRVARDHCRKDPFTVSALTRHARERLDDDDIYGLAAGRPIGELVALICRDLGLQPDWDALAGEAWAQAEIAGGAEGSPFLQDEDGAGEDDPDPLPPPRVRPASLQDTLAALARDPQILAAAHRDTG